MLWPTLISIAAVIVVGVPFTYLWFRWADRWADAEKRRFRPKTDADKGPGVRVIRDEPADRGGR